MIRRRFEANLPDLTQEFRACLGDGGTGGKTVMGADRKRKEIKMITVNGPDVRPENVDEIWHEQEKPLITITFDI